MPLFIGAIDAGGDQPTVPGTPTAVGGDAIAVLTFTLSTYTGKTNTVIYSATSTPGSITATGLSPLTVTGLTNGVSYTFKVTGTTDYGVASVPSASSNAVTPAAPVVPPPPPPPPPGPPPPPPPPPCAPQPWPQNCTRVYPNTCDGTYTYEYYDCGGGQTCPGTGGYNGQQINGSCGYVAPAPVPACSACVYTVTGQSSIPCGCFDIRFILKQWYITRTFYSTSCTPVPCTGCSCPQSSDGPCNPSNVNC
jgi:hypothetical protein